jgi:opacity protein-like surface antigen
MKRFLFANVFLVLAWIPAVAADLQALPVQASVAAPPLFSWTDFYIGINANADWERADFQPSPAATLFRSPHYAPVASVISAAVHLRQLKSPPQRLAGAMLLVLKEHWTARIRRLLDGYWLVRPFSRRQSGLRV